MSKSSPIPFNPAMILAREEGRKNQTRRGMSQQPIWVNDKSVPYSTHDDSPAGIMGCRYGQAGDSLWVKEAHYLFGQWMPDGFGRKQRPKWRFVCDKSKGVLFAAPHVVQTDRAQGVGWWKRSSMFMPRWASRTTLEIVSITVERLQDISAEDAINEGIEPLQGLFGVSLWKDYREDDCRDSGAIAGLTSPIDSYKSLWESINGVGSWDMNPCVWRIEFK